jgi:IclR family pca regulon transcriptional regulator
LRNDIGESCALAVLDETEIVYALRLPARRILSANLGIGSRLPHLISLGRVLLAALPQKQRDDIIANIDFKQITPRTVTCPIKLGEALARIEQQGYAWIDGELDPAICGIAVPVRDQAGNVVAAVSINTISGTITEEEAKQKFLVTLKRTAQDIRTQTAANG